MCREIKRACKLGVVRCLILLLHVFDILSRQPHRSSDRWFRYFLSGLGLLTLFLQLMRSVTRCHLRLLVDQQRKVL